MARGGGLVVGRPTLMPLRRPPLQRRSNHGQALVGILVAAVVWGTGSAALVRWTVWLVQSERAALQHRAAAATLENALEQGSLADMGSPAHAPVGGRTLTLADGTALLLQETRHAQAPVSDPLRGAHVVWTASWQDPWGNSRSLSLASYWAPIRRVY